MEHFSIFSIETVRNLLAFTTFFAQERVKTKTKKWYSPEKTVKTQYTCCYGEKTTKQTKFNKII